MHTRVGHGRLTLRSREIRRQIRPDEGGARAPKRVALSDVYLIREAVENEEKAMRSPILAAILSLIVAGLGQIYNGQVTKGVIFIVIQLINGALTGVLVGWLLLPLVGLWAMIEAYMTAKHNNERYGFR
jgi:TM2 domain-containing membrane protein YozV